MSYRRLLQGIKQYVEKVKNPFPPTERVLFTFDKPAAELAAAWQVSSDSQYGGQSTAQLVPCDDHPGAASFSGRYSTALDAEAETALQRSGFCSIKSMEQDDVYLDLDDFNTLVLRVRGDGRKYIANLRTESWVVGSSGGTMRNHDVYQAFLFARAGVWQDVRIPLSRFLLTWKGRVVEEHVEMNRGRITSLGISLAGGPQLQPDGPFRLDMEWIKAVRAEGYK